MFTKRSGPTTRSNLNNKILHAAEPLGDSEVNDIGLSPLRAGTSNGLACLSLADMFSHMFTYLDSHFRLYFLIFAWLFALLCKDVAVQLYSCMKGILSPFRPQLTLL